MKRHLFLQAQYSLGLRGAIAFALSLFMAWESDEARSVMIANTLAIVLFTTMILGGATMPLLKVKVRKGTLFFCFVQILNRWFDEDMTERSVSLESEALDGQRRRRRRKRRRQQRDERDTRRRRGSVNLSKTHEMVWKELFQKVTTIFRTSFSTLMIIPIPTTRLATRRTVDDRQTLMVPRRMKKTPSCRH